MKALKIATAALITSLAFTPLFAQASTTDHKANHRAVAAHTIPGMSLHQLLVTLNTMQAPRLDVQPATPEPASMQLAGSNYGNASVLLAAFPAQRTVVMAQRIYATTPETVHATLTRASY